MLCLHKNNQGLIPAGDAKENKPLSIQSYSLRPDLAITDVTYPAMICASLKAAS